MEFLPGLVLAIMLLGVVAYYFSPFDLSIEEEED